MLAWHVTTPPRSQSPSLVPAPTRHRRPTARHINRVHQQAPAGKAHAETHLSNHHHAPSVRAAAAGGGVAGARRSSTRCLTFCEPGRGMCISKQKTSCCALSTFWNDSCLAPSELLSRWLRARACSHALRAPASSALAAATRALDSDCSLASMLTFASATFAAAIALACACALALTFAFAALVRAVRSPVRVALTP
jgi:hypothetical protein